MDGINQLMNKAGPRILDLTRRAVGEGLKSKDHCREGGNVCQGGLEEEWLPWQHRDS